MLEEKQIKPPFIPQIKGVTDVMYFDKQFTSKAIEGSWIEMPENAKNEDSIFDGFTYEKMFCDEDPDEASNQIDKVG